MPAFTTNGPDVPDRLSQAHEEGRVVFFCGAGISYPAGLPGFKSLVEKLYKNLKGTRNSIQHSAIKAGNLDTAVGLLESDIIGGRIKVRQEIARLLTPDLSASHATTTHEALLTLARNRNGQIRLITTNFDRLFEEVIASKGLELERFRAPLLPIPKNRWDGLVYLHGLLPFKLADNRLNDLVVSSGDFGLAYLNERWASRFVSELFRNYTVCFVGYSLNDPVLRYMTDALAADKSLGESIPEMYAFGSYTKGTKKQCLKGWDAKNVTPILYREHWHHAYLHRTLREWAKTYRDGVRGKEMIIAMHASTPPLTPSRADFAVGRVLWGLTDRDGLAAKHFACLDPVPPLEWLDAFTENQFEQNDFSRFGIVLDKKVAKHKDFSMIHRPTPYTRAPWMCLVNQGSQGSEWDDLMSYLADWLIRHLNDLKLILWLVKQGGQLHEQFAWRIRNQLAHIDRLKHENNIIELKRITGKAPNAIPNSSMRTLWRLFLSGRVKTYSHHLDLDFYDWLQSFKLESLTPTLRFELREILIPLVTLRKPFRYGDDPEELFESKSVKSLVEWEIVFATDHVHDALQDLTNTTKWQTVLPELLQDFQMLLRDALDLMWELEGANEKSDLSYIHLPSISEHPQNRHFHEWTVLIELVRDAWLETVQSDRLRAQSIAKRWWHAPYPVFKRLALFAATHSDVIAPQQALEWLLSDGHWWLWSVETIRETMRLLVITAQKWDVPELKELEEAILKGPPREMYREELDPLDWSQTVDREIWLRLAKLQDAGAKLGTVAKEEIVKLRLLNTNWNLEEDERDEFPIWMGDDERHTFDPSPRHRRDLVEWLKQNSAPDHWQRDDWRKRCRDNFPTTACALCALVKERQWPVERWREALQVWAEEALLQRSWRYMAQSVALLPDEVMQKLKYSLGWWLKEQAKTFNGREELFFALVHRLLNLSRQDDLDVADTPVSSAINHPVGHITQGLLNWWYRQQVKKGDGLLEAVEPFFTELCDLEVDIFRHGRVILATHVIALFRVDEEWTRRCLIPLFDWSQHGGETAAIWEGFLRSPRLYHPLLAAIKQPLLDTSLHYTDIGENGKRYAAFLAFVALEQEDTFKVRELADATETLPAEGLENVTQTLVNAIEGTGEQRVEYWHNRLLPYLRKIWPKSRSRRTLKISENLGRLCIAANEAFPEALAELRHWLQPVNYPNFLIRLIYKAQLCHQFPKDGLTFLDAIVGNDARLISKELRQCLDDIKTADGLLANDSRFVRLTDLYRRRGRS